MLGTDPADSYQLERLRQVRDGQMALIQCVSLGRKRSSVEDNRFKSQFVDIQLQWGGRLGCLAVPFNREFGPDQGIVFEQGDIQFDLGDKESGDGVILQINVGGGRFAHHVDDSFTGIATSYREHAH